jgi:cyclopropane-fatty-acyl-phospholipid synthase
VALVSASALFAGTVRHRRRRPAGNAFRYAVYHVLIDLDEVDELDRRVVGFGHNRAAVTSLHDVDHLGPAAAPLRDKLSAWLAARNVDLPDGPVRLLTGLRVLGYVFNPVSWWFCHHPDGRLALVVAEVANTFGESYSYLLDDLDVRSDGTVRARAAKAFHVSPFLGLEGHHYDFVFRITPERILVHMDVSDGDGVVLDATQDERRRPLTTGVLLRALLRHPHLPLRTMALIHRQAVRLWWRGTPFHRKPEPPGNGYPGAGRHPDGGGRRTSADVTTPVRGAAMVTAPTGAQRRTLQAVAGMLDDLEVGSVRVTLPDGRERLFGDVTSELRSDIEVRDWRFFTRLLHGASVGVGESFMLSEWTSSDLVSLFRIVIANRRALQRISPAALLRIAGDKAIHAVRANRLGQSRRNISAHYDLSNELYALFLDDTMTYSAGYFEAATATLEDAQVAKYRRLADKIHIGADDHVLEIGCGWGGFAVFAASTYGCRVTGVTLSEEQAAFARRRVREAGLDHLVGIRVVDYRRVRGSFDRIVSIEMLEAVGHRYLGTFFATIDRLLAPDGLAAVQVITIPEQRYDHYRRRPDFIQRYIFPGGHLPSLQAMTRAMGQDSELFVEDVENIGPHYAETLRRWRERFTANVDEVRALGFDDRFVGMWEFYLAYCEAAFLARYVNDLQVVLTRPMNGTLGVHPYGRQLVPVREADLPPRRHRGVA